MQIMQIFFLFFIVKKHKIYLWKKRATDKCCYLVVTIAVCSFSVICPLRVSLYTCLCVCVLMWMYFFAIYFLSSGFLFLVCICLFVLLLLSNFILHIWLMVCFALCNQICIQWLGGICVCFFQFCSKFSSISIYFSSGNQKCAYFNNWWALWFATAIRDSFDSPWEEKAVIV